MGKKIKIAIFLLIIGFIIFSIISFIWIKNRMMYASTDAVFIKSDSITNVGFKRVSGRIVKMNFKEGDRVKKGDILTIIDDRDYRIKADQLKFEIDSLEKQIDSLSLKSKKSSKDINISTKMQNDRIAAIDHEIKALEKNIGEIDILMEQANRDYERFKNLYEKNAIPKKNLEDVKNHLDTLKLKKDSYNEKLKGLMKNRDILKTEIGMIENNNLSVAEIEKNKQSLTEKLNSLNKQYEDLLNLIDDCKLIAPQDGTIGMKFVDIGSVVSTGNYIYSIVDNKNIYAYVLMEENKMAGVDVGDKAFLKVDAFPKEQFEG